MKLRAYILVAITSLQLFMMVIGGSACSQTIQDAGPPLILGLDHIPLAVKDLETAAEHYRELGFVLKPGRPHENGIRNQHIKFPDGTEIELITAHEARDPLTAEYLELLAAGDGAAFVGFYAPELDQLAGRLDAERKTYRYDGGLLTFPESDRLRYIFFGNSLRSPTDQPEHFKHLNGAEALIGVWIAGDELAPERQLFTALGAAITDQEVYVPEKLITRIARLQQAEVVFLPASRQIVPGHRIVGATIRTSDIDAVQHALAAASLIVPPVLQTAKGLHLFVPPGIAHGMWLEFRQDTGG